MNWSLLQNSLLVAGMTTALAAGFGLVAAVWLATLEARWRNVFLALAIVAIALPPFLVTNCWIHLLGETGMLRAWVPFRIYSLAGTVWILSLMLWPITLFAVLSAWRRLEAAHFECDPALTGFALFRWLLLPSARGELLIAAVLTFVLALNNFAVPAILQTKVLPDEVWIRFNTQFDALGALQLSVPLLLAPLLLLALFTRRGVPWPRLAGAVPARVVRRQVGAGWIAACGVAVALLCLLAVAAPLTQIVFAPRTWLELGGAVHAGTGAIWNSFAFAAVAACVVMGLAVVAGQPRDGVCPKSRRKSLEAGGWKMETSAPLRLVMWLPFFIPGVLLGIALIWLFNRPGLSAFYQSAGIIVLALTIRYFALGWTAARHALDGVDRDLTDAARFEGASRRQMWRYVWWPQTAPQLAAIWYVVYVLCLWDVESMVLIVPPGGETLALRIFNLLHYGHAGQVNALCLVLLGLAVAPLLVWIGWGWVAGKTSNIQHSTSNTQRNTKHQTSSSREASSEHGGSRCQSALTFRRWIGLRVAQAGRPLHHRLGIGRPRNDYSLPHGIPVRAASSGTEQAHGKSEPIDIGCYSYSVWRLGFLWCLALGVWGFAAGCSPGGNETRLNSRLFERAVAFGARGVGIGEFNKPRSVTVDTEDNIYAVDMTGRVQKFSPRGEFLLSWQMPETDLGVAKGMGRDGAGNILVIEPHYQRVNHYTPDGTLLAQWGCRGTMPGCFTLPRAVAVNSQGDFLVTEYMGEERVQRFRVESIKSLVSARLLQVIGGAGTGPGEFNRPEGVAVDGYDRIYVADSCNHRIQMFSADGKFIRMYGRAGTGLGELSYPYDIAVDAQGYQFVCEFGNSRIQVFNADCEPVEIIGGPGMAPGRFSNPWAIALDTQGNLVVADGLNHRVQKLMRRPGQIRQQGQPAATMGMLRADPSRNPEPRIHRSPLAAR